MKHLIFTLALAGLVNISGLSAAEVRLPSFLPDFYRTAFEHSDSPLVLYNQNETNGVTQFVYQIGAREALSVGSLQGDTTACRTAFNNILAHLNQAITTNEGAFVEITEDELFAEIGLTDVAQNIYVLVLPHAVNIWTHSMPLMARPHLRIGFDEIRALADRQRYEEALQEGNVSMGKWQKSIHNYARQLLAAGKSDEAVAVLKNLLVTSPFDYDAHIAFMDSTSERRAATNSARVIMKNAEDPDQLRRAADFLGIQAPTSDAIPVLSTNDTGLEVVLIPLPPCNPWLLDEAAQVYERITDVPVKIRRLDKEWTWRSPERLARQRELQTILTGLTKHNINFANWTSDQYLTELADGLKSQDAASKYWGQQLITKVKSEPGQYRADSYLEALNHLLEPYRSDDSRTMYVALTGANIYSGDDNFVFSLGTTDARTHASLMSYYMMLGKSTAQAFDSRQRLVERIAKELVPASLKQLRIPRSSDPTCPYSYSSGLERLDQKSLTLSDGVKEALNKFRDKAAGSDHP